MLAPMSVKHWMCCWLAALGMASLASAAAPLPLGADGERVAVVTERPGDEVVFYGGVLQECVGMGIPLRVVFLRDDPAESVMAMDAAELLDLPVDAQEFLANPAEELPALLEAFGPTAVLLTPGLEEGTSPFAGAWGALGGAKVLVAEKSAKKADYELELMDVQLEAKAGALKVYGRAAKGDKEFFRVLEAPVAEAPAREAPAEPPAEPPAAASGAGAPAPVAPGVAAPPRLVPKLPSRKRASGLMPKTHLPPPPSPWDEPVQW